MKIDVLLHERVFVFIDGEPKRYLGPGEHSLFAPFKSVRLDRVATQNLLADLDAARLALVPSEDLTLVTNAPHERAVVYRKGKAALWLGTGTHQVWTVDRAIDRATKASVPLIRIDSFDVSGIATKPLKDDVKAIAPASIP